MPKSGSMHSDRVSTTASSEGRKSSKPIMEKRRRARINASLAELKSLLLEVIKKEGARHSKMEKADILEMAVKHLRQIQRQQYSAAGSDPTLSDKYRLGYNECAQEVSRYLGATEDDDAELRARLLNHLANCITNSDSSSTSSSPVPGAMSPDSAAMSPSPSGLPSSTTPLQQAASTPAGSSNAAGSAGGSSSGVVAPVVAPIPVRAGFTLTSQSGGSPSVPHAFMLPAPNSEINNNVASLANNNIVIRNVSHAMTLATPTSSPTVYSTGHSAGKVISELQMMPSKAGGGEVAFVLPASHLHSYIIYTPSQGLAANAVSFTPNAPAPSAVPLSMLGAAGMGNAGLVTLTPGAGLSSTLFPPSSLPHVVAPLAWHPATAAPVSSSSSSVSPAPSSASPSSSFSSPAQSSSSAASCSPRAAAGPSPASPSSTVTSPQTPQVLIHPQPLQLTFSPERLPALASSSSSPHTFSSAPNLASLPHILPGGLTLGTMPVMGDVSHLDAAAAREFLNAKHMASRQLLRPQPSADCPHADTEHGPWRPW